MSFLSLTVYNGNDNYIHSLNCVAAECCMKMFISRDVRHASLIHPTHKKNNKTNCSNYRGISLFNVTYKVMAKIIAKRFTPYTEEL
jgi:hypothetical protein